ncbi:hypothetical protein, partial [Actinoplanes sp. NPDC048796]|uniref:hypothetical protein n=1 Tax=Actinoplanes sp. NPDC048796 TaxID=3155640 RepID=UPI00341185F8
MDTDSMLRRVHGKMQVRLPSFTPSGRSPARHSHRSASWACPVLTDIRDQEPVGLREDVQHHGERGKEA